MANRLPDPAILFFWFNVTIHYSWRNFVFFHETIANFMQPLAVIYRKKIFGSWKKYSVMYMGEKCWNI